MKMKTNKMLRILEQADNTVNRCLGVFAAKPAAQNRPDEPPHSFLNAKDTPDRGYGPCDTACVNDKSGSMATSDCNPSRIEAGKIAAEQYIRRRAQLSPGDQVGLISFDSRAEVVLGLTSISDTSTIMRHLRSLKAGGGTDINQGLKAAEQVLFNYHWPNIPRNRFKRILLLTDGHGGNPIRTAKRLKAKGVLIEAIGIGGDPSAVDEKLLKKVATTDSNGFTHYWFFRDTESLVAHYEDLATGIIFRGQDK